MDFLKNLCLNLTFSAVTVTAVILYFSKINLVLKVQELQRYDENFDFYINYSFATPTT